MEEVILPIEVHDSHYIFDVEEKIGKISGWQIVATLKEQFKCEEQYTRKFQEMYQELLSDIYQRKILEELYEELLYQILHNITIVPIADFTLALVVLQILFDISPVKQREYLEKCMIVKHSEIQLSVEVLAVNDLKLKNMTNIDDAFIVMFLDAKPESQIKISLQNGFCKDHIFFNSTESTINDEKLMIEIWEPVKAKSKLGNILHKKKLKGSNESRNRLVGSATLTTTSARILTSVTIQKDFKRDKFGSIDLKVVQHKKNEHEQGFQAHRQLLKLFLLHELGTKMELPKSWSGKFEDAVEKILLNHKTNNMLADSDVALVRYSVFVKVHDQQRLEFLVFYNLLLSLMNKEEELSLTSEDDLELFWEATSILLRTCFEVIVNLKRHMNIMAKPMKIINLILKCNPPETFDLFSKNAYWWVREEISKGTSGILQVFKKSLEFGSQNFIEAVVKGINLCNSDDEAKIIRLVKIAQLVVNEIKNAHKLDQISNRVKFSTIFIDVNQKYLYTLVEPKILKIFKNMKSFRWSPHDGLNFKPECYEKEEKIGKALWQLYVDFKQLSSFGDAGNMEMVHSWFNFDFWLEVAKYDGLMRITKAVTLDNFDAVYEINKFSSSAVDTIFICEGYIKTFDWPENQKTQLLPKIIENFCDLFVFYIDLLIKSFDCGNANEIKKYCQAFNNLDYISKEISSVMTGIDIASIENVLEKIANITDHTLITAAQKSAKRIYHFVTKTKIHELNELFASICSTIQNELSHDTSKKLHELVWLHLSEMVIELISTSLPKKKPKIFYARLKETIQNLCVKFGPEEEFECNYKLKEVQALLELHTKSNIDLIQHFYKERLTEQQCDENSFITVQCCFESNKLCVEVLNAGVANSAMPMNPYVNIRLLPESVFKDYPEKETEVQNNTNYPLFDAHFEFELTGTQRSHEGTMLMLRFKNRNLLKSNIIGECFLSLNDIPEKTLKVQKRLIVLCSNFEYLLTNNQSFGALQYRKNSKRVCRFLKKYPTIRNQTSLGVFSNFWKCF